MRAYQRLLILDSNKIIFFCQVEPPIRRLSLRYLVENALLDSRAWRNWFSLSYYGPDSSREAAVADCCREERQERREKVVRRPDIFRTRHDHIAGLAITQAAPRVIGARMIDGPFQHLSPVRGTSASWNSAIRFRRWLASLSKVGSR